MPRLPDTVVVASHNAGKVREIRDLLEPLGCTIVSAQELDLPEPEEDGETFEENAVIKARAAANASGLPALSDDSGLCVDALDGKPGIHSARWAGPDKDFALAMRNIEEALQAARADTRSGVARASWRCSALPFRTAKRTCFAARSRAAWCGRRAATRASATIPSSCPKATSVPSAK